MDDFGLDRPQIDGSLISMEFGSTGRIHQLWASDPALPEEGEEFQFVLNPITFGEEFAEDYFPGTILLGARTNPEEPWILSRNTSADYEPDPEDPTVVNFEYEMGFLPELRVTGRYYEIPGPIPQIAWDVRIANRGRVSVEIGEVGFPFALNNLYEGYGRRDQDLKNLWKDRVYIHKSISGAASYIYAQRVTAEPPGLLIFPGDDTSWEFFTHVPSSLNTPLRWAGIPVVYVHSRAAVEREGWGQWFNEHTALVLEPGDSRVYQTRFVPAVRDHNDQVGITLAACDRPALRVLPAAVAPSDVGIGIEVTGATPTRFFTSREAQLESDSDEEGGFCFVRPAEPGPIRLTFEDTKGRQSHAHLLFIDPLETKIKSRAQWIAEHQVHHEQGSSLDGAITLANIKDGKTLADPDTASSPFAIDGGLGDALFLAEKNTIYPNEKEISILEEMVTQYLLDDLQNPADFTVGSAFSDGKSVALNYARPQVYPLVFNLYHCLYRIGAWYGMTKRLASEYLEFAQRTANAMFVHGLPRQLSAIGLPTYSRIHDLISDLYSEGHEPEADHLSTLVETRARELLKHEFPFAGEAIWDTSGFEEVFSAAHELADDEHQVRTLSCAFAARGLAASWWWYGGDVRLLENLDGADRGGLCMGYTSAANSLLFFETLDRDYTELPDAQMRMAFGGLLGVWGLVRNDGAASMGFCPDSASRHLGWSALTGDLGIALFHYLRGVGAYVLPNRNFGVFAFGCHFELENDHYVIKPWDGVGRRVILRQIGAEFEARGGRLKEVHLGVRKRRAEITLESTAPRDVVCRLTVRGLWGNRYIVDGKAATGKDGELTLEIPLPRSATKTVTIRVDA